MPELDLFMIAGLSWNAQSEVMNRGLSIICVAMAIVSGGGRLTAQENGESLRSLEFQMEVLQADVRRPLEDLRKQYNNALERLQASEQGEGNLESVLGIRKERAVLADGSIDTAEPPSIDRLASLRNIYLGQRQAIGEDVTQAEIELLGKYLASLEALKSNLTKSGEIEDALEVARKIVSVSEQREALAAGQVVVGSQVSGNPDEEVIVGPTREPVSSNDLTAEKEGDAWVLTSPTNNAQLSSRKAYSVPYRIDARVATDSTNIRFHFAQKGKVIFNWERNPEELRIHDPVTGKNYGLKGEGEVDTDEMHDISIEVESERVRVFVGKRERGEIEGDFTTAEGVVGIGPAFGSRVSVERFSVTQLKEDE